MPMLHDLMDNIRKGKVYDKNIKLVAAEARDALKWVLANARDAVCFGAGPYESISPLKFIPELFHFPYEVTWVEGSMAGAGGISGCLCVETGERQWDIALFEKSAGIAWVLVAVNRFHLLEPTDTSFVCESVVEFSDNGGFEYCNQMVTNNLAYFLMALNCTNVSRVEHVAPKILNAERKKKGKQPIFSYWTLHLPNESGSSAELGGTHASPRLHLRRGHIRQYAPGKHTWVQACVVGSKELGMVTKDYRVSP